MQREALVALSEAQVKVLGSLSRFEGVILETILTDVFRLHRIEEGEMPDDVVTRVVITLPVGDAAQFFRAHDRWWERLTGFLAEMARRRGKHGFSVVLQLALEGHEAILTLSGRNWRVVVPALLDVPQALASDDIGKFVYAEERGWEHVLEQS